MGETLKCKSTQREFSEKEISFEKEAKTRSDGGTYIHLHNDDYSISLFESKAQARPGKKSRIKYNATIILKKPGVAFQMPVKELVESGQLLAGQTSRLNNHRAVVTEWDSTNEKSYERMSVPSDTYAELMSIIEAGTV
jgi:hypothetical protein